MAEMKAVEWDYNWVVMLADKMVVSMLGMLVLTLRI